MAAPALVARTLTPDEFPFIGPTDLALSPVLNAQRSFNLYYEPANFNGAKSPAALVGTPGMSLLGALPASPVRALWAGNGRLFGVGGSHFAEVDPTSGLVIHDYGTMSGDAGTTNQQCTIVPNPGVQLLVHSPTSAKIYFANPGTYTMDAVFNGYALEVLDGYYVAIAAGASLVSANNPNQINVSDYNDGSTAAHWPATNYVIKEGSVDPINQLAVVGNLLWIFGTQNIEIWYNAGNPLFPFARVNGGVLNVGCLVPATVSKVDDKTVMWLGSSQRGYGQIYMNQGFSAVPVSTPGIEALVNKFLNQAYGFGSMNAFSYAEDGHVFYQLNLFTIGYLVDSMSLVYDLTTKLWHERSYYSLSGETGPQASLASCFASVTSSPSATYAKNFVGSRASANIYKYGLQYTSDAGNAIQRFRTAGHIRSQNRWVRYPWFELDADIGGASVTLGYSNDGGRNFVSLNRSDVTKTGSADAARGAFQRFKWLQLGASRDRVMRVVIYDGTYPIRLIGGYLGASEGIEK